MLALPITQWHIKTPSVYRYLPEEYVDDFFDKGKIRLSSFAQFAKYPDEEKGDNQEGRNILVGENKKHAVFAVTNHGYNAYVLCGSTIFNAELMKGFNGSAAIEIKNPTQFGIAVARRLSGVTSGIEGFCYYHQQTIDSKIPDIDLQQLKENAADENYSLSKLNQFISSKMTPATVFFRKRIKYQHQCEYRLIWVMNRQIAEAVTIECPEARAHCVKRKF
jgi:hypothetical protein